MASVEIHDEDVDYLLIIQFPAIVILGIHQIVHHVFTLLRFISCLHCSSSIQDAFKCLHQHLSRLRLRENFSFFFMKNEGIFLPILPLLFFSFFQKIIEIFHFLPLLINFSYMRQLGNPNKRTYLESSAEGKSGEINGHGSDAVVQIGVHPLQRLRRLFVLGAQKDLHNDPEREPPELGEELDALPRRARPPPQGGDGGLLDEPEVAAEGLMAVDGRGGQPAEALVLLVHDADEGLVAHEAAGGGGPAGDEVVVVHEDELAGVGGGDHDAGAPEHECLVHANPVKPATMVTKYKKENFKFLVKDFRYIDTF